MLEITPNQANVAERDEDWAKRWKSAKTGENQRRRTVHGQPAGRHDRAPVAEATHGQHGQAHGWPCAMARPCVGPGFRNI